MGQFGLQIADGCLGSNQSPLGKLTCRTFCIRCAVGRLAIDIAALAHDDCEIAILGKATFVATALCLAPQAAPRSHVVSGCARDSLG